jgi:dihydroneopterin aldolase
VIETNTKEIETMRNYDKVKKLVMEYLNKERWSWESEMTKAIYHPTKGPYKKFKTALVAIQKVIPVLLEEGLIMVTEDPIYGPFIQYNYHLVK